MAKSKITYIEYLQLLGLFRLAETHNRELRCIQRASARILDEPSDGECGDDYYGCISDAIVGQGYSGAESVDELLNSLEVKVDNR